MKRTHSGTLRTAQADTEGILQRYLAAIAVAVLVLLLAGSALLYAVVFGEREPSLPSFLFCWSSLALALGGTVVGWFRSRRTDRLERQVGENLLTIYEDERDDLEVWLSTDLIGRNAGVVRQLVEMRLDRKLARRPVVSLATGPFLAMVLVVFAALLLGALHVTAGVAPWRSADQYLRGFVLAEAEEPPEIARLSPSASWVEASDLENLEVLFDREPPSKPKVFAYSGGKVKSYRLSALSAVRYRARLRSCEDHLSLRVAVGRWNSEQFDYHVYPNRPVVVTAVQIFDAQGKDLGTLDPQLSPFTVPEGARVVFELFVSDCPLETFGLGGSGTHGELGLTKLGEGRYSAQIRLFRDTTFQAFWQLPAKSARLGREIAFAVRAVPVPEVQLLAPADGERVGQSDFRLAARCAFKGKIDKGYLLGTDYMGVEWAWELPVRQTGGGAWDVDLKLPTGLLGMRSGRVVGLCVAVRTLSGLPRTGRSEIVNILLPAVGSATVVSPSSSRPPPSLKLVKLVNLGQGGASGPGPGIGDSGGADPGGTSLLPPPGGAKQRRGSGGGGSPGGQVGARTLGKGARDGEPELDVFLRKPKPPQYARSGMTSIFGRKIHAEKVKGSPDERARRSKSSEKDRDDLDASGQEVVQEGREIDTGVTNGTPRSQTARRHRLSATEIERRIKRYSTSMGKLTAGEKRAVREYYKLLRDLAGD